MSRVKTYPITGDELDDLTKALDADRAKLAKICKTEKSAIGWWRYKNRIPIPHLEALLDALQKQLTKKKERTPVELRALRFSVQARVTFESGEADVVHPDSAIPSADSYIFPEASVDLSTVSTDALLAELKKRSKG